MEVKIEGQIIFNNCDQDGISVQWVGLTIIINLHGVSLNRAYFSSASFPNAHSVDSAVNASVLTQSKDVWWKESSSLSLGN